MEFNPDEYLQKLKEDSESPDFDPDRYLNAAKKVKPESKFSEIESYAAGAAQGIGSDFLDELYGARKGAQDVLIGGYPFRELGKRYQTNRDIARDYYNQAQEANPISYGAGGMTGGGAQAFVPFLSFSRLGKLGAAAASSALSGLGASDKESYLANVEDAAKSAAFGAGLTYGVGKLAPDSVGAAEKGLRRYANEKAVVAGGAMTKQLRQLENKKMIQQQGDYMLRNKIVTPLSSLEDIKNRSDVLRKKAGEKIGLIIDEADRLRQQAIEKIDNLIGNDSSLTTRAAKGRFRQWSDMVNQEFGFSFDNVANRIDDLIIRDRKIAASRFHRDKLSTLSEEFKRIAEEGPGTLREGLENKTNYRRLLKNVDNLDEQYKQEVYDIISDELEKSVGKFERLQEGVQKMSGATKPAASGSNSQLLLGSDALDVARAQYARPNVAEAGGGIQNEANRVVDQFKQANRDYAAAANAQKTAESRLGTVRANRDYGLTTAMAVMQGVQSAGAAGGVAAGAVNNFFRKYGSQIQAVGAYKVANMLRDNPNAFGAYSNTLKEALRRGPRQFLVTNYLIGKSDPQYVSFLEKLMEGE